MKCHVIPYGQSGNIGSQGAAGPAIGNNISVQLNILEQGDFEWSNGVYAVGGRSYEKLRKNSSTQPENFSRMIENSLKTNSDYYVVTWNHGEANKRTPRSEYLDYLRELYRDISAAIGQPNLLMFLKKVSSDIDNRDVIPPSLAMLDFANENPNAFLVGAKQHFTYTDGVHLTADDYSDDYAKDASVIYSVARNGEKWKPLQPVSSAIGNGSVDVTMHVPVMPLQIDTAKLPEHPNGSYGFELIDEDGDFLPITNVHIVGRVISLFTPNPHQAVRVRYAYSDVADFDVAYGNIKDSDNKLLYTGSPSNNWLVHFDEPASFDLTNQSDFRKSGVVKLSPQNTNLNDLDIGEWYQSGSTIVSIPNPTDSAIVANIWVSLSGRPSLDGTKTSDVSVRLASKIDGTVVNQGYSDQRGDRENDSSRNTEMIRKIIPAGGSVFEFSQAVRLESGIPSPSEKIINQISKLSWIADSREQV